MGWSVVWSATGVVAAAAASPRSASHPRAAHIGIVITADEVFVSWHKPAGATSATLVVRRGEPVCPRTPAEGVAVTQISPVHSIDRSVKSGGTYCYTVFRKGLGGAVTTLGTTGAVTVPDVHAVPPLGGASARPVLIRSQDRIGGALVQRVAVAAGVVVAAVLTVLVLLRGARRVSTGRVVLRPTMRESIVGRNTSALVVPAMIALGWIGVLIGFVVLR